jgi:hypothetical protein
MPWKMQSAQVIALGLWVLILGSAQATVQHPMDPLEDTEILNAAFILLGAGAAEPGAIFQSSFQSKRRHSR